MRMLKLLLTIGVMHKSTVLAENPESKGLFLLYWTAKGSFYDTTAKIQKAS